MSETQDNGKYLLVDSRQAPLARAVLESSAQAQNWQIRILDDKIDEVMKHELVQMVSMVDGAPSLLGRIIRNRGDRIVVEPLHPLEESLRQNLRMPVRFESFIYPLSGKWTGRRTVQSLDLSCGGIAFYCEQVLEDREQVEVVIPITGQPLVLRCEVIRQRPSSRSAELLYACKFVDLCEGEERMVREAVFGVQLRSGRN